MRALALFLLSCASRRYLAGVVYGQIQPAGWVVHGQFVNHKDLRGLVQRLARWHVRHAASARALEVIHVKLQLVVQTHAPGERVRVT